MRKVIGAMAVFLLVAFSTIDADGQQIPVVQLDRATVNILSTLNPNGPFVFSGPTAQINGNLLSGDGNVTPGCAPCFGGDTVPVLGIFQSRTFGQATINGNQSNLWILYGLLVQAPQLTLPTRYSRAPFYVTVPATLTGAVKGYVRDPYLSGDPGQVFESPLNMEGSVTLKLRATGDFSWSTGRPMYQLLKTTYNFQHIDKFTK